MSVLAACGPTVLSDFGPAEIADDVIASADGIVMAVIQSPKYGTEVVVLHDTASLELGARYRTGYLHLQRSIVRVGERVTRGAKIELTFPLPC